MSIHDIQFVEADKEYRCVICRITAHFNSIDCVEPSRELKFETRLHADAAKRISRDKQDAQELRRVFENDVKGREIDTITSVKHMQPTKRGYLVTEFVIMLV